MLSPMEPMPASHDELLEVVQRQAALIVELRETIARLEARVRDLEDGSAPPRRMPGHKREQVHAEQPARPRRKRAEHQARRRSEPTARVMHAIEACPDCCLALAGGSVKRSREVLEIAPSPVTITEHVYLERCCPGCGKRWTPRVALEGVVLGRSRLGVGLVSLIATLREEARLPIASIQTYLASIHGLRLSVGGIVGALEQVVRAGQTTLAGFWAEIRASAVLHADETGWREAGRNQYLWSFSTPTTRAYVHGGRGKGVFDAALGIGTAEEAAGILVSDFYAVYDHYPGLQQKCWVHLWRDIHELLRQHPDDAVLSAWAAAVAAIVARANACASPDEHMRQQLRQQVMTELGALCQPYQHDATAPQARVCRRIAKYLHALFVFVLEPGVPADNNAAERSLRHAVISRKISGGTRSADGTATKVALASLFGTWRLRGDNPYLACRQLLSSPQA